MTGKNRFEKLLEPYHIGSVKTRNRIIKPAAGMRYWSSGPLCVNETSKAFYEAQAKGGCGLLMVESPDIDYPVGLHEVMWWSRLDDDKYIGEFAELVKRTHKYGCPTFMQFYHCGPFEIPKGQPIAASAVIVKSSMDLHNQVPHELTIPEIKEMIDKWAKAAVRAEKAGFDGIEINASSTHLLHTFLSRFWNKRQDIYGCQNLENRTRIVVEIIQEIKKRLGQDFPVTALINAIEIPNLIGYGYDECVTLDESQQIARILEKAGADAIQTRSHWISRHYAAFLPDQLYYPEPPIPAKSFPEELDNSHRGFGANVPLAAAFKKVLHVPVITVGGLNVITGEKALREGKADFIGLNRALIADPEIPNKLAAGRFDDIAPCTHCGSCQTPMRVNRRCRINATVGTEDLYNIEPAQKRKKVAVIGGGPAGMEAARVAAIRGHDVTLYEKSARLGGLVPLAALVKGLEIEDLPALVKYLEGQVNRSGVKIELGKEADAAAIEQLKPDAVILAAGGLPSVPEIPGIDNRKVIKSPDLHRQLKFFMKFFGPGTLNRMTRAWLPIGKNVVIIGGSIHGCELAEFLMKRGRNVTIVESSDNIGDGMIGYLRAFLLAWFATKKSITVITGAKCVEITDKGLTIIDKEAQKQTLAADTIIPAMPLTPDNALLKSLEGKVPEIYAIGDCKEPRLIADAIADGYRLARTI